jgi:hypothetical protein
VQHVGLVVRRGLQYDANPDLTSLTVSDHGDSGLRSDADITLHLADGDVRVRAVHLEAMCERDALSGSRRPARVALRDQLPPLQACITARTQEGVAYSSSATSIAGWMTPIN